MQIPYTKLTYIPMDKETVEMQKLHVYNRAAIANLILWLTLCEQDWHVMKLTEWEQLMDWLVPIETKQVMYNMRDEHDDLWWPDKQGPDICGTCYKFFGMTLGGRVREGCIHCNDSGTFKYYIYHMRDHLYVNGAHMEWLLATALWEWSKVKPRMQARTQKWIRDNDARFTGNGLEPMKDMEVAERDRIRELEKDLEVL